MLLDYPTRNDYRFLRVNNIQTSLYEYTTSSAVTSSSDYSSNVLDSLIPNYGHIYLVIPGMYWYNFLYTEAAPAAGSASLVNTQQSNTQVIDTAWNSTDMVLTARESLLLQLHKPGSQAWWGLDAMSDGGSIDYQVSPYDNPNPEYMFAVTDNDQTGTIQMKFTMPSNNLTATAGLYGRVRFYVGFFEYELLKTKPSVYTVIPTQPPYMGIRSQVAPSAQPKPNYG
jgi:hypothetical protein